MTTFIVEFWSTIFSWLAWVSPFRWIRALFKSTKGSYLFVEIWVLSHLVLSVLLLVLFCPGALSFIKFLLIAYGCLRVFEIVIYQINVLFFDEYRAKKAGKDYAVKNFRRLVLLLLHNYVEIIFWYALGYLTFNTAFQNGLVNLRSACHALGLSFNIMTTFGIGTTSPIGPIGFYLVFSQGVIGLFMALVVLARFIALLPSPKTLDG